MTLPPLILTERFQCAKLGGVALVQLKRWDAIGGEPLRSELLMQRVTDCQQKWDCGVMRKDQESGSWKMDESECLASRSLNVGGES